MTTAAPSKIAHLLVFRDPCRTRKSQSCADVASLLCRWLEWHDKLRAEGVVSYCSAIDGARFTVRRLSSGEGSESGADRSGSIVGCLVVEAVNLAEAESIARECPGLDEGFEIDIFRVFDSIIPK